MRPSPERIKLAIELASIIQQGPQGVQGETGEQGIRGIKGLDGLDGKDGRHGDPGIKGDPGITPAEVIRLTDMMDQITARLDALESRKVRLTVTRDKQGRIAGLVEK